jgi:hypothetical protein
MIKELLTPRAKRNKLLAARRASIVLCDYARKNPGQPISFGGFYSKNRLNQAILGMFRRSTTGSWGKRTYGTILCTGG